MYRYCRKLTSLSILLFCFIFLTGLSSLDYTRKVEPLPDMPEGNPDLSLGIVVRANSTGRDVLADSSQNIRFRASKNFEKTDIERLSSSSKIDRAPKKFKFIDGQYSFSSDNIYEFVIVFNDENHQWKYMRFMPFPSVIEWVTEDKLKAYLNQWAKIFESSGWERMKLPQFVNQIEGSTPHALKHNYMRQYWSWTTKEYEASIDIRLRDAFNYKYYVPKTERKNINIIPDGYIAFIEIIKKP